MTKAQLKEFFNRLEGKEGCNFRYEGGTKTENVVWDCGGGNDKSFAIKILKKMGVAEEEAVKFLVDCNAHGGHCDCEIIFNAKEHFLED